MDRKIKAIEAIDCFYKSLTVDQVEAVDLVKTTGQIESVHAELDEKLLDLEEELEILKQQIRDEQTLNSDARNNMRRKLGQWASIMIAAEKGVDVEIVLVYGTTTLS